MVAFLCLLFEHITCFGTCLEKKDSNTAREVSRKILLVNMSASSGKGTSLQTHMVTRIDARKPNFTSAMGAAESSSFGGTLS